jgi:hypothetical protein
VKGNSQFDFPDLFQIEMMKGNPYNDFPHLKEMKACF